MKFRKFSDLKESPWPDCNLIMRMGDDEPVLVGAIQELIDRVATLESQVASLTDTVWDLHLEGE
jgi:hypothetical protein